MTRERNLDEATAARLSSLLSLGDPTAEVALAYRVKEALAEFYGMAAIDEARERLSEIVERIGSLPTPRAAKAGTYPFALVRKDHGLPRDPAHQRPHRGAQQPSQTGQAGGLWLCQLRELPHPGASLRRKTQLEGSRLHSGGVGQPQTRSD